MSELHDPATTPAPAPPGASAMGLAPVASSGAPGPGFSWFAPGVARDDKGQLTKDGKPPDTTIGGIVPGGGAAPAWKVDTPPDDKGGDIRSQTEKFWQAMGAPLHVAQGIADRIDLESGFKPGITGDPNPAGQDTSGGLYQHHADRWDRLKAFADKQGKDWKDPAVQNAFAALEVRGGDPIAAAHWQEILQAPTREKAEELWTKYFERPAGTDLRDTWGPRGTLSPEVRTMLGQMDERTQAAHADNQRLFDLAEKQMAAAAPGSAERQQAIADMRRISDQMFHQWQDISRKPPVEKPVDLWQNFGSMATIVALLGGLAGHRHLTTALNAAGTAMQAINSNNHEQFQTAYKTWSDQVDLGIKMIDVQNKEIQQLLADEKIGQDEKNAKLSNLFSLYGMQHQDQALQAGNDMRVVEMLAANDRALNGAKQMADQIKLQNYYSTLNGLKYTALQQHPEWNGVIPPDKAAELQTQAANTSGISKGDTTSVTVGRERDLERAIKADDAKWLADHPDAESVPEDVHYQNRVAREKELADASRPPRSAPAMALRQFFEERVKATGKPPTSDEIQDFVARGVEKSREAGAIGTRSASLEIASNVADGLIPLVKQTSDKINRTQYPSINSIILAWERGTGDPDVVQYAEMINALSYAYARALSPTGQARVRDLDNFSKIVEEGWAKGQIDAALEQIHTSIGVEKAAVAKTRDETRYPDRTSQETALVEKAKKALAAGHSMEEVRKAFLDSGGKPEDF